MTSLARNFAAAANAGNAPLDVAQPVPRGDSIALVRGRLVTVKAASVVAQRQNKLLRPNLDCDAYLRRGGMFDDIVQALFERQEQIVSGLGG